MRIFISYSRKDKLFCDAVVQALQDIDNVDVYIDTFRPAPGTSLPERIKQEIESCDLFVVLLTESGIISPWVTTEVAWASSIEKQIVPLLQYERSLNEIPSLRGDLEYIKYDPADYQSSLDQLKKFIEKARKERRIISKRVSLPEKEFITTMERLDSDEILDLLLLKSADLAPSLEQRLIQNAKSTVADFFLDPRYATLTNVGTLATDASVVVIRKETLHALLRAAQKGNSNIFRREGYEAGSLFGMGVVKWFLEKSATVLGRRGLPNDTLSLLEACARIDDASGWGNVKVSRSKSPFIASTQGWDGIVSVKNNFLAYEISEERSRDSKDSIERYNVYKSFWKGYLEGTYSAALGTWYGMWAAEGEDGVPLFEARCDEQTDDKQATDLIFRLSVRPPFYNITYMNLQRELFCPYLRGENARVVRSARGVIEGFIRELAGSEAFDEDVKGILRALTWLGQNVDNTGKGAAAHLQETRNLLHENIHDVTTEPSDAVTRRILRITTGAVLMACRDIRLDDKGKMELRSVLSQRNTG